MRPRMIILEKQHSEDGSIKYLWQLDDEKTVESIYFTFQNQLYICVSSQVGCDITCPFCETGKQRNLRNLRSDEIYDQVALSLDDLKLTSKPHQLYQVAVAGMGEALLNFENVKDAATQLIGDQLAQTMSVSTSGIVPKIRELVNTDITKLFISLHATTDETRNLLVPVNKKYPISELLSAAHYFYNNTHTPVTATYLLFEGMNDSREDLTRLTALLDPQIFVVQLSEWNSVNDTEFAPSHQIEYFREELASFGFNVFVLRSKGRDVAGGCGQLRSRRMNLIT